VTTQREDAARAPATRIALVVDDEPAITELVRDALTSEGFSVDTAFDGLAALRSARKHSPDIVVLDIGLPGLDGFEVCRALRKETNAPVVFLTARGAEVDRIVGLELGADDYIVKPFSPRELIARVRAVLRRSGAAPLEAAARRVVGAIAVDAQRREVTLDGKPVRLKPREFDVLWLLACNEGRVFTRDQLIETVWGFDFDGDPRTVDVHVRRIRRALGDDARAPRYLHTIHGLGYKLSTPGAALQRAAPCPKNAGISRRASPICVGSARACASSANKAARRRCSTLRSPDSRRCAARNAALRCNCANKPSPPRSPRRRATCSVAAMSSRPVRKRRGSRRSW
jgi:DNA-binding response OmpR family regulator